MLEVHLERSQVRLVNEFLKALLPSNLRQIDDLDPNAAHQLAQQMLMGQGKTAVITPLLCLLLADGRTLPIALLPVYLLVAARDILRSTFSTILHKQVYTLDVTRASRPDVKMVKLLDRALLKRSVIVTTPPALKSIILKFIENLIVLSDEHDAQLIEQRPISFHVQGGEGQIKCTTKVKNRPNIQLLTDEARMAVNNEAGLWAQILKRFGESVLIMDELDWVCHPLKSELK